jgi:hypothetical protein
MSENRTQELYRFGNAVLIAIPLACLGFVGLAAIAFTKAANQIDVFDNQVLDEISVFEIQDDNAFMCKNGDRTVRVIQKNGQGVFYDFELAGENIHTGRDILAQGASLEGVENLTAFEREVVDGRKFCASGVLPPTPAG